MEKSFKIPAFRENLKQAIVPISIGHEVAIDKNYRWDNKRHGGPSNYLFFQYTLKGHGYYKYKNDLYKIKPEHGFFCSPKHDFLYYFDGDVEQWEFVWIGFTGDITNMVVNEIIDEFGPVINVNRKSLAIETLFDIMKRAEQDRWQDIYSASSISYSFLLQLLKDARKSYSASRSFNISEILSHIDQNISEPIDVSTISFLFGYSREHFSRLFRQAVGISPGKYLINMRLDQAKKLIRSDRYTLDEVAKQSGLTEANYLCRVFKKYFNVTPGEYKNGFEGGLE